MRVGNRDAAQNYLITIDKGVNIIANSGSGFGCAHRFLSCRNKIRGCCQFGIIELAIKNINGMTSPFGD